MSTVPSRIAPRLLIAIAAQACIASWALLSPGCNTMEGAGKDVKQAGQSIENKAAEKKNEPD